MSKAFDVVRLLLNSLERFIISLKVYTLVQSWWLVSKEGTEPILIIGGIKQGNPMSLT